MMSKTYKDTINYLDKDKYFNGKLFRSGKEPKKIYFNGKYFRDNQKNR